MEKLVIKEKFMKIVNCILLFFVVATSCQSPNRREKFQWNAGISAPKYYLSTPFVEYFYQGKGVAGTSTNVGINPGWGINSGGYTGGDKFKSVPDSVYVKWSCAIDLIEYEGGSKLPKEKCSNFSRRAL